MSNAPELPPVKIAFVIDNIVADVLHTDERLAAIFLSEPVAVDVTDQMPIAINSIYNPETKTFTAPDPEE